MELPVGQQDLLQCGAEKKEPVAGPPRGGPGGWPVTRMWYEVLSLLASWATPWGCPDVSGTPHTKEKALWVIPEALEKPRICVAAGPWAGCFFQLCKLRLRLHFAMQQSYVNSRERRRPGSQNQHTRGRAPSHGAATISLPRHNRGVGSRKGQQ